MVGTKRDMRVEDEPYFWNPVMSLLVPLGSPSRDMASGLDNLKRKVD
jgi:hypothetical protein